MIPVCLRRSAAIASVILVLSGCMGRFNYQVPKNAPVADKTYDCTVRVDPFNDDRPKIGGTGPMWLYTVPGVIYGYGFYNRPEDGHFYLGIAGFKFKPKDQLAQAAQKSIKHADIFKKAYMKNHNWEEPDLVFTGNIKSTKFKERMYSYGLSVFGPLLWLLGAPDGWTDNHLKIQFILKQPGSESFIWKYTGSDSVSRVHWFYYQGQDVKGYVPAMQHIMANAIDNLQESLKHKSMWSICQGQYSQAANTRKSQHNSSQSAVIVEEIRKAEDDHPGALVTMVRLGLLTSSSP